MKEIGEKSIKLLSDEYKKSIEKTEYLLGEIEEVKVYLKTLEDLVEMELGYQGEVYNKMYKLSINN